MSGTNCKWCGCELTHLISGKGRARKWCSKKCRSRWTYWNDPRTLKGETYIAQKERGYANKWKALELRGCKCQMCGESRPSTLCFHHRDPDSKSISLDSRSFANLKWSSIEKELEKCDLLCHNCHCLTCYGKGWEEFLEWLESSGGGEGV